MRTLAHLEVQIKFTDDLGPLWAVNGHGVDEKFMSFEGPCRARLGRDHDGRGEVPWNGLSCIVTMELTARCRSPFGRPHSPLDVPE